MVILIQQTEEYYFYTEILGLPKRGRGFQFQVCQEIVNHLIENQSGKYLQFT